MDTQVVIVGGGPSGMLLSELLHLAGVDSIVLEKHDRAHVLGRIRAGVLEPGTVRVLQTPDSATAWSGRALRTTACASSGRAARTS